MIKYKQHAALLNDDPHEKVGSIATSTPEVEVQCVTGKQNCCNSCQRLRPGEHMVIGRRNACVNPDSGKLSPDACVSRRHCVLVFESSNPPRLTARVYGRKIYVKRQRVSGFQLVWRGDTSM
eukprot:scaffold200655_cov39-Prasinocladus_malaysianus.AAC.1